MLDDTSDRASFHAMVDGTADDYAKISAAFGEFSKTLPDRVMAHLKMLQGDFGGFAVDRFEHSLQTAQYWPTAMDRFVNAAASCYADHGRSLRLMNRSLS